MEHIAIMRKSWKLLPKILNGSKRIESRWYKNRSVPWGKICGGDKIYFKNSGEKITAVAMIERVMSFSGLKPDKVKSVLVKYGELDGIEKKSIGMFYKLFKRKRYCLLIFLKGPREVEPFEIDKRGFGAMAAWITVPSVEAIRRVS